MHQTVIDFCQKVKRDFPQHFQGQRVLDVGSLNVNGTNRYLFHNCDYTGCDVVKGMNVDLVSPVHMLWGEYDTIISTEAFEHDKHLRESIEKIVSMLAPGGLFIFTCATIGRQEHGTTKRLPTDSGTSQIEGWCDYYKNVTEDMIEDLIEPHFLKYEFNTELTDLQFYGIKE